MTAAFENVIKEIKTKMINDQIPAKVYIPFIDYICKATAREQTDQFNIECEETIQLLEQQHTLGTRITIHHRVWKEVLQNNWTPPQQNAYGKAPRKKM